MKRLATILAFSAFTHFGYAETYGQDGSVGISLDTPLGTAQAFDRYFLKLGMIKKPPLKVSLPEIGTETVSSITYVDHTYGSALAGGESVTVFVDDHGALRAVVGGYRQPADAKESRITPISEFLASYWKEVGGNEPTFAQRIVGESPEFPGGQQQFAMMSRAPVYARWIKGGSANNLFFYVSSQGPGVSPFVPSLADWHQKLKSPLVESRLQAATTLALFGPNAVPALVDALQDDDYKVRHAATTSLIRIGPEAVPRLKPVLAHVDNDTALRAAEALAKIGPPGVPVLVDLIKADYSDSWQRMLTGLHHMTPAGRAAAIPELINLLQNRDNEVRERAAIVLNQMGPYAATAMPWLVQMLGDTQRIRGLAKGMLVRLGNEAIPHLREAMRSSNLQIRMEAIDTIGSLKKDLIGGLVPELIGLCSGDPDPRARAQAKMAARKFLGHSTLQEQCK